MKFNVTNFLTFFFFYTKKCAFSTVRIYNGHKKLVLELDWIFLL